MANKPATDDPKALRKAIDEVAKISASISKQLEDLQQKIQKINQVSDW
ncbi:hypothetical protein NKJ86_10845 [Mesorhizobium sp. M0025]